MLEAIKNHQNSPRTVNSGGLDYFPQLVAGSYSLSIQASDFNYSVPRDNSGVTLGDYSAVEVAVFRDGDFFNLYKALPELSDLFDEMGFTEGSDIDVAGYVSWVDVERLYEALMSSQAVAA